MITTGVEAATGLVVMVKLEEVRAPAATVTLAGTEATAGSETESVTTAPPPGALLFKVTVAVVGLPPPTLAEARPTLDGRIGSTVKGCVTEAPL